MTYEVGQTKKFELTIQKGDFTDSEIIVLLGENGTGKTTFIRYTFNVFKGNGWDFFDYEGK